MRTKLSWEISATDVRNMFSPWAWSKWKAIMASQKPKTVCQVLSICKIIFRVTAETPSTTKTNDLWPFQLNSYPHFLKPHRHHLLLSHYSSESDVIPDSLGWLPAVMPPLPGLTKHPLTSGLWFLSPTHHLAMSWMFAPPQNSCAEILTPMCWYEKVGALAGA